ncbi:hypothetical protein [Glycomyces arizonensis]|uniref:hypothetical protein n=1 Tax=Glycomyces arizonensis TaxID=256035 RepID=UPI000429033F|nr:hypothetical protein [Glycomyces arizonensis]
MNTITSETRQLASGTVLDVTRGQETKVVVRQPFGIGKAAVADVHAELNEIFADAADVKQARYELDQADFENPIHVTTWVSC